MNEAVWQAIDKADTFKGESQFATWFQTIVQNLCVSTLRQKQRKNEVALEAADGETVVGNDGKLELEQLMKPLKSRQKKLITLKLQGMSEKEIGTTLGITELAVRHAWARVKEKLRGVAK